MMDIKTYGYKAIICTAICFQSGNLIAQNNSIITDRPDQTESAAIVPPGYLQFEHGLATDVEDVVKTWSVFSTLIRYGVTENFELRLNADPHIYDSLYINELRLYPVSIGIKTKLIEQTKAIPDLSIIIHVQIPEIASENLKADHVFITSRLVASHTLADWWNLGYNIGIEWDGFTPQPTYIYTLTNGFSVKENIGFFIEIFGNISFDKNIVIDSHFIDGGFTYLISDNIQIDVSGGVNMDFNTRNYFFGAGLSYRFPIRKLNNG